jgi:hypothetical protein
LFQNKTYCSNNGLISRCPALQTLSFNGRISYNAGAGIIVLMIKWISFSKGVKLTYANII